MRESPSSHTLRKGSERWWRWRCQPWGREAAAHAGLQGGGKNGSRFSHGLATRSRYRQPAAPLASSTQPVPAKRFLPAAQLGWN